MCLFLLLFYYAGHVKLISLGALLFSEGKWRISRSVGQESGLRTGSKGGCGQDTLKERKIKKKKSKKKDNENENKNRENKKKLIVRMAQ